MKSVILVVCAVLLACFSLQTNALCQIDGQDLPAGTHNRICKQIECFVNGSSIVTECPHLKCIEKTNGQKSGDKTKVFPGCCDEPICSDTVNDARPKPLSEMDDIEYL